MSMPMIQALKLHPFLFPIGDFDLARPANDEDYAVFEDRITYAQL